MDKVLIDTDVILDFFFDRKPHSEYSAQILTLCELEHIQGFITPVIYSNLYYILKNVGKHEKVIEKLDKFLDLVDVLTIDKNIIKLALQSNFKDFEDSLQNFAAEVSGCVDIILTRNIKDFKKSSLSVMSPEDYLKIRK